MPINRENHSAIDTAQAIRQPDVGLAQYLPAPIQNSLYLTDLRLTNDGNTPRHRQQGQKPRDWLTSSRYGQSFAITNIVPSKYHEPGIPFYVGGIETEYLLIPERCRGRSEKLFKVKTLRFSGNDSPAVKGIPFNNCCEVYQASLTDC